MLRRSILTLTIMTMGVSLLLARPFDAVDASLTTDESITSRAPDNQVAPGAVTAAFDGQLLDLIEQFAEAYYNPAWDINVEQFKAWMAAIAWGESGRGGYGAHSQAAAGSDVFNHRQAGPQFRFSTGIGPFQIDRGGRA